MRHNLAEPTKNKNTNIAETFLTSLIYDNDKRRVRLWKKNLRNLYDSLHSCRSPGAAKAICWRPKWRSPTAPYHCADVTLHERCYCCWWIGVWTCLGLVNWDVFCHVCGRVWRPNELTQEALLLVLHQVREILVERLQQLLVVNRAWLIKRFQSFSFANLSLLSAAFNRVLHRLNVALSI